MRLPLRDLRAAVEEQRTLKGLRVDNVYQCGPRTFLLKLTPGKHFLLVDLERDHARVLVTDQPPEIPDRPPTFGMILRKALRGATIVDASLLTEDRVVGLDFDCGDESRRLVAEAFPLHGNLLLLDAAGTVLRVLDGAVAKRRGTPIGGPYSLPKAPTFKDEESLLEVAPGGGPFACNLALDACFRDAARAERGLADEKSLERMKGRLKKLAAAIERELAALPDPEELRRKGELLLVHFAELRQGAKAFRGVALDPKLSPQENIERIFERARKTVRARPILEERAADAKALLARVEAGEAVPERELPGRRTPPGTARKPYRVFQSRDGHRILVGKGGADNDTLTLKVAGPNDIFLHVRGTPGSHVIVPLDKKAEITQETLLDAASLALHYSKMRSAASAEVTYTPKKHVSKPKGAKPGLVQVRREKVLRLRREADRIARLLSGVTPP